MSKVEKIISRAQTCAEELIENDGSIEMMFHAVKTNGDVLVISGPYEKMRLFFAQEDVVAYVCIAEGSILESKDPKIRSEAKRLDRIRDHPLAREVVSFHGEDDTGHYYAVRDIIRPSKGKAKLGPLRYMTRPGDGNSDQGKGGMWGLLPRRGAMQ
jgi:hypothetical protein